MGLLSTLFGCGKQDVSNNEAASQQSSGYEVAEPYTRLRNQVLQLRRGDIDLAPTYQFPLPGEGRVRFYLVVDGGVLTAEAAEDDLGEGRHPLSPLFLEGHQVIAAVREHASG